MNTVPNIIFFNSTWLSNIKKGWSKEVFTTYDLDTLH